MALNMKRIPILQLIAAAVFPFSMGVALGQSNPTSAAVLSPVDLMSKVRSLKQEQVAWRQVEWRTCLIEGLKESRRQGKPILLWIFIDRPIDDERC